SPQKILDWIAEGNSIHAAFLDINMPMMNGLTLATRIKLLLPECMIVFVTGYTEYAVEAFTVRASGYLVKPVDLDELRTELNYIASVQIQKQSQGIAGHEKGLFVQCFGTFDVFVQGSPMHFRRQKSKEIFAFLVDRKGASVTLSELASILWEDGMYDSSRNRQLHTFIHDLIEDFKGVNITDIICKSRNSISVNTGSFDCDYYEYFNGNTAAINAFTGEYMSQYSWAEITVAKLTTGMM
ncbi:MAG: response regulator, partial [Lachnospiraceae bacterium]|nr:response regulator [Lachnospiraceae bacterium]